MDAEELNLTFPARAGMNRIVVDTLGRFVDVPRTSGDEPISLTLRPDEYKRSPHERG